MSTRLLGATNIKRMGLSGVPELRKCFCPAGDSTAIYHGDFVQSATTGGVSTDSVTGCPIIKQAAVTGSLRGIACGFVPPVPAIGVSTSIPPVGTNYRPASTAYYVLVCEDPFVTFHLRASTTTALTDAGKNVPISVGVSGDTLTGTSGMQANSSSPATSDNQIRIISFVEAPDVTVAGTNSYYVCKINDHEFLQTTGT